MAIKNLLKRLFKKKDSEFESLFSPEARAAAGRLIGRMVDEIKLEATPLRDNNVQSIPEGAIRQLPQRIGRVEPGITSVEDRILYNIDEYRRTPVSEREMREMEDVELRDRVNAHQLTEQQQELLRVTERFGAAQPASENRSRQVELTRRFLENVASESSRATAGQTERRLRDMSRIDGAAREPNRAVSLGAVYSNFMSVAPELMEAKGEAYMGEYIMPPIVEKSWLSQ